MKKYSFGDRNPAAQGELDRFLANEDYLETLRDSFNSLAVELLQLIDCTEEASKNYSSLAENFAGFTNLKGANIDQIAVLSKDISLAFQSASTIKKDELEEEVKRLKEPIDDYRLMIEAAVEACTRRRKLVFRFYELNELHLMKERNDLTGS